MAFQPKPTKKKVKASYKTLYINDHLIQEINRIARENDTSFNNVVISMIEHCSRKRRARLDRGMRSKRDNRLLFHTGRIVSVGT